MPLSSTFRERALLRLQQLYCSEANETLARIEDLTLRYLELQKPPREALWDEGDTVLITYGDQIRPGPDPSSEATPLLELTGFLKTHGLEGLLRAVHLLPFFPYSSDDGFSIIDYREVDPHLGTWEDVAELGKSFDLMFDLVLNHCSRHSRWFQEYQASHPPYDRYFIEVPPGMNVSEVTRPRSLPLLTPVETAHGIEHVWTTFSDDQIDLNFAHPDVLIEMLDVLLGYVAQGARIIRLDAVAYLWKRLGTSCIHLPETHAVVKLMRDVLDEFAPGTILLTETNVPHEENVSYFGDGDEAHIIYQFSLAPLLLDALLTGDGGPLTAWLAKLPDWEAGTTVFNFTASHDGIGVRPLEGLVPAERFAGLIQAVRERGGQISTRRQADGRDVPYEMNITYFSALGGPGGLSQELHVLRFLTSQAVMLALRGIPGIYFHSLVGTPNDEQGVAETGRARSINRRKFTRDELESLLAQPDSAERSIFEAYRRMLKVRTRQPAFHPDALQRVIDLGTPALVAFRRASLDQSQTIAVVTNLTATSQSMDLNQLGNDKWQTELLSGNPVNGSPMELEPYATVWIST